MTVHCPAWGHYHQTTPELHTFEIDRASTWIIPLPVWSQFSHKSQWNAGAWTPKAKVYSLDFVDILSKNEDTFI